MFSCDADDDDTEYMVWRGLSLGILCLSPLVVFQMLVFRPPTYGKHVTTPTTVSKTKQPQHQQQQQPAQTEQQQATDTAHDGETSDIATATPDAKSSKSPTSSSSSLSVNRKELSDAPKKCQNTTSDGGGGATTTCADDDGDGDTDNSAKEQQQQPKQHERHWLGPLLPAKWSWVVFESPCWIWVVVCVGGVLYRKDDESIESGEREVVPHQLPLFNALLLGWFFFHYVYRSIWYPLVMMSAPPPPKKGGKPTGMPFGIVFFAWCYCCINGYLQARGLTKFCVPVFAAATKDSVWSTMEYYQFWLGMVLTLFGFSITITSDRILAKLKRETQEKMAVRDRRRQDNDEHPETKNGTGSGGRSSSSSHYAIPRGGLFDYVSSPHYFGELLEWTGFCIASDFSMASLSFVVWSAANLVPRAIHTHKWYHETFGGVAAAAAEDDTDTDTDTKRRDTDRNSKDVPKDDDDDDDDDCDENIDYAQLGRKAIIPFIL